MSPASVVIVVNLTVEVVLLVIVSTVVDMLVVVVINVVVGAVRVLVTLVRLLVDLQTQSEGKRALAVAVGTPKLQEQNPVIIFAAAADKLASNLERVSNHTSAGASFWYGQLRPVIPSYLRCYSSRRLGPPLKGWCCGSVHHHGGQSRTHRDHCAFGQSSAGSRRADSRSGDCRSSGMVVARAKRFGLGIGCQWCQQSNESALAYIAGAKTNSGEQSRQADGQRHRRAHFNLVLAAEVDTMRPEAVLNKDFQVYYIHNFLCSSRAAGFGLLEPNPCWPETGSSI